jgi:lysophospholipase L1-like esterase
LTTSVATTDAGQVLSIAYNQPAGKVIFASTPFHVPPGSHAQGISFEYCGDGSSNYASVVLGNIAWDPSYGYEALFPLDSTAWKKITLGWNSFVQSYLPWDTKAAKDNGGPALDPSAVAFLSFGWGQYFNRYLPTHASFQVRNVQLVDHVDQPAPPATFSPGWSHTLSLLGSGKPIKILLLGDSITDFGGDHSYGYFLGQKIKATWGNDCTVANCGIGGHTVRGGLIILPRSLRTMPDPDLVFILFGGNDTKAVGLKPGFDQEVFKTELEQMIDRVRIATGGQADICLLSGVARLAHPAAGPSTGVIEKVAPGIQEAAAERKTAYVDSLASYLQLTPDQQKQYYRDTIHQQPAGHEYIAGLIFTQLQSAKNAAPR